MSTNEADKRPFNEPKPDDTFLLQDDGRVITYAELIELAGETPESEADLDWVMTDQNAVPIYMELPKDE
ncbi:MAG: hypothetical protein ACI38Z_08500 [Parafannyhessea sp.]|uniref:hypothetical protein n=1 Tax=Parafannyhessea sp. TaxID=2847324 RepID=UPI003F008323